MLELAQACEILERTPGTLRSLVGGLSDGWTQSRYGEGTWCAAEVVGHLVIAEREDWMPRVRRILEHGEKVPFEPFAHDATIAVGVGETLAGRLKEFERLRSGSLGELRGLRLGVEDLERTGMHPALGRVTAGQLVSTWAVHDLHHVRQACLAMAWRCREEVGPWRAYLNTLAPR